MSNRWVRVGLAGALLLLGVWVLRDVPVVGNLLVRVGLKERAPEPWRFEFSVEIEFDGKAVRLGKVIECQPVRRKNPAGRRYIGWTESQYALSKALPDGSGLMAIVPRYCFDNIKPVGPYSPLILWVDDVRAPKLIEAFYGNVVDHDKLGSRLKILKVATEVPTEKLATPRLADEFADKVPLGRRLPLTERGQGYFALIAFTVPKEMWQEIPMIAQSKPVLAPIAQVTEREQGKGPWWIRLLGDWMSDGGNFKEGWYPTSMQPNLDSDVRSLSSVTKAMPLRKVGDVWVVMPDAMGTVVYYSKTDLPDLQSIGPLPITYKIFGHKIEAINSGGAAFLFSDRDDLIAITSSVLAIRLLENPAQSTNDEVVQ